MALLVLSIILGFGFLGWLMCYLDSDIDGGTWGDDQ